MIDLSARGWARLPSRAEYVVKSKLLYFDGEGQPPNYRIKSRYGNHRLTYIREWNLRLTAQIIEALERERLLACDP